MIWLYAPLSQSTLEAHRCWPQSSLEYWPWCARLAQLASFPRGSDCLASAGSRPLCGNRDPRLIRSRIGPSHTDDLVWSLRFDPRLPRILWVGCKFASFEHLEWSCLAAISSLVSGFRISYDLGAFWRHFVCLVCYPFSWVFIFYLLSQRVSSVSQAAWKFLLSPKTGVEREIKRFTWSDCPFIQNYENFYK